MRGEISPTARALRTLELLQNQPGITADALAARLGVSTRAVRRYVEILREAGIPVHSERGPAGGYRLGRGLRLPPLHFEAAEAIALVMAVLDGHHAADDPDQPVGRAIGKILRALPRAVAAQAESVRATTRPSPDRGAPRPAPEVTVLLVEATSTRRRARIAYRSEAGREWTMDIEPWAVVVRYGRWYLLCRSVRADAVRTYRVDRILDAEVLDVSFEPPADLDPVAALETYLGEGWEFPTELLIHAPLAEVTGHLPRHLGRLEAVDEATSRLTGSTSNPAMYVALLAELPVDFTLVGGDELRTQLTRTGQRLLAAAGERVGRP